MRRMFTELISGMFFGMGVVLVIIGTVIFNAEVLKYGIAFRSIIGF